MFPTALMVTVVLTWFPLTQPGQPTGKEHRLEFDVVTDKLIDCQKARRVLNADPDLAMALFGKKGEGALVEVTRCVPVTVTEGH